MFSPGAKKLSTITRKNVGMKRDVDSAGSPATPLPDNSRSIQESPAAVPNRPSTGTPAPWASRLSVLARIPSAKSSEKSDIDAVKPVYLGDFPQTLRDAQSLLLQNHSPADAFISGGMDKETSLAWITCDNRIFIWNYLSTTTSRNCVVLDFPSNVLENGRTGKSLHNSNNWLVCVVNWDDPSTGGKVRQVFNSVGIVMCNKRTDAVVFWPNIYSADKITPLTCLAFPEESEASKQGKHGNLGDCSIKSCAVTSLIASAIPDSQNSCIALACSSSGTLWKFICSPSGIQCKQIENGLSYLNLRASDHNPLVESKGYPRSLIWHSVRRSRNDPNKQFFLLTNNEIQCFGINLSSQFDVSKMWSHEIVGTDGDLGIQKDLAGQKRIWPLDLDIDHTGKVITILIAIFCKDRITSSSYTEYSLLTMQYKSGVDISKPIGEKILEKKAPIQVIIPKARVEDENFLFSMRLKIGGKPAGSAVILSGDGTATVSHYWRNSTKLYQFGLPYDAGKVLDASLFPSSDNVEDGTWAVLTEKAGVWAIPEQAVLLGGVEPPERSLSRKGSSNDGPPLVAGNIAPRRASSEAWDSNDQQKAGFSGVTRRSPQDEESEALLNQFFHDFLLSGQVDGVLDKLKNSKAFEKEGETNVFPRTSKSIVDTLAKHWTTTRGPEIVLSAISTQLIEKQQKHHKFLHFLALSKCHEELSSRQRQSLQIILEHGEKLAGMIQLRELQNMSCQTSATGVGSYAGSHTRVSGALWDLIQLAGERARRNTVFLMDRDNAEVFYSKVSDLEELFHCLDKHLEYVISEEMPAVDQFQRVCELSNACVTLLHASMQYKSDHHVWYPPPEGLTPWYSKSIVWNGLWRVASFMLHLLDETNSLDDSARLDFYSKLGVLAEVLLESYSNAITGKVERKEDFRSLLDEYWKCRDALLNSLYQKVKGFVQAKLQEMTEDSEVIDTKMLAKHSSRLLSIAKRHEGYQTMWSICCDLNDSQLLQTLMHESMGPRGGFSFFVFEQLYESKQFPKLLRLGEEFQEELAVFLKQHPHHLWLHEVFLQEFSSASETLHALSLSKDDQSTSVAELNETGSAGPGYRYTLANRKHFLNLAKIAAMAGRNDGYQLKLKRIEADLNILQLQEEIWRLVPDNEEKQSIGQKLLPPVELIELCLKIPNRELTLRAFDLFTWTSASFLRNNTSLLEECWRNAANQDDWERLHDLSNVEGWSDERTLEILRETMLFQVSSRCYGPAAETFEGRFDEVLPLRQGSLDTTNMKESSSSVETILMQHKDFPDAGKLMMTAVLQGSLPIPSGMDGGFGSADHEFFPMER